MRKYIISGAVALLCAGVALIPAGTQAAVDRQQYFDGRVNDSGGSATVYVYCPNEGQVTGSLSSWNGEDSDGQSISVVQITGSSDRTAYGYTGNRVPLTGATSISATLNGSTYTWTDYGPKSLTSGTYPCSGSETVTFTANGRCNNGGNDCPDPDSVLVSFVATSSP